MIISNSRRFIFVHIHKSGGTSVELALDPFLSWNDLILGSTRFGEEIGGLYENRFGLHKHSSVQDIERICGAAILADYYLFATVRHPLARVCSLYNFTGSTVYSVAAHQGIPRDGLAAYAASDAAAGTPLRWLESRAFIETKTFSEFIRDERLSRCASFATQVSRLRSSNDGAIRAEVCRIEDVPDWLRRVRSRLALKLSIGHANVSELKLVASDAVGAEDRAYIQNRFADDYSTFGYE